MALSCLIHGIAFFLIDRHWGFFTRDIERPRMNMPQQSVLNIHLVGPQRPDLQDAKSESVTVDKQTTRYTNTREERQASPNKSKLTDPKDSLRTETDRTKNSVNQGDSVPMVSTQRLEPSNQLNDSLRQAGSVDLKGATPSKQEHSTDLETPVPPFDLKKFGQSYGKRMEQESQQQQVSRIFGKDPQAHSSMRDSFEKHLKSYGQTWTEYRANDGTSWVRFSGGSCVKVPEPDYHEHRHLNKTITLTDCPSS